MSQETYEAKKLSRNGVCIMEKKSTNSICPNCNTAFVCSRDSIDRCFCNSISISEKKLIDIRSKFKGCLCKKCLEGFVENKPLSKNLTLSVLFFLFTHFCFAQFHVAAGLLGTSAMHKDSSAFVGWASQCSVTRGWQDISNTSLGVADVGVDINGTMKAGDNPVVSLGDGGYAILTFNNTIKNGPGYDFAVFENSFSDTFLELAFVEVSSDGINYFRFPATSNLSFTSQIGPFDQTSDPTKINNLAGKYRVNFGTPFDLEELKNRPNLSVNAITHVKIIDVVGSVNSLYATYDINNSPINDPFPTNFGNGGFDLDAVGVIHQNPVGINEIITSGLINLFPNPCSNQLTIKTKGNYNLTISITDSKGLMLYKQSHFGDAIPIETIDFAEGIYFVKVETDQTVFNKRIIISR